MIDDDEMKSYYHEGDEGLYTLFSSSFLIINSYQNTFLCLNHQVRLILWWKLFLTNHSSGGVVNLEVGIYRMSEDYFGFKDGLSSKLWGEVGHVVEEIPELGMRIASF